jgi:hypothetical protein
MQKDITTSWGKFDHGQSILTESALQLTTTDVECEVGVTVRAHTTNTGYVYVGNSDVTTANGYQLAAGESVILKVNNVKNVYAVGSVNPQTVSWIAV